MGQPRRAHARDGDSCCAALLDGERADFDGEYVHAHGFRLRRPQPEASLTIAAFGPAMTRVAARHADEVVLNLVSAEHVADGPLTPRRGGRRGRPGAAEARGLGASRRSTPARRALAQLSGQLAVYLGAPGYGELFAKLGFGSLVERARAGERRGELAAAIPRELLASIGAIGSPEEVRARIAAYHARGGRPGGARAQHGRRRGRGARPGGGRGRSVLIRSPAVTGSRPATSSIVCPIGSSGRRWRVS